MGEAKRCAAIRRANQRQAACGWDADGAPTNDWPSDFRRTPYRPAGAPAPPAYVPPAAAAPPPPARVVRYVGMQTDGTVSATWGDVDGMLVLRPLTRPGRHRATFDQAAAVLTVISSTDEPAFSIGERVRLSLSDEDAWLADILEDEKARARRDGGHRTVRPVLSLAAARMIGLMSLGAIVASPRDIGPDLTEPPPPRRKR